MNCPHCQSTLLFSEDRGAHCDGCDDFDPEKDLIPSDLSLQLFLAKQLPEEIEYRAYAVDESSYGDWTDKYFFWTFHDPGVFGTKGTRVTPREWDYIVRRVEEKLMSEQKREFVAILRPLSLKALRFTGDQQLDDFDLATASWQTRARALQQIL